MTGIYNTMGLVAVVSLTATFLHFVATRAMGAISMASRAGLEGLSTFLVIATGVSMAYYMLTSAVGNRGGDADNQSAALNGAARVERINVCVWGLQNGCDRAFRSGVGC
jgi:hypothetical protein